MNENPDQSASSSTPRVFTPASIGPVRLRNRTIRSAAFEGMGKDNNPTEMLLDYHRSVAAGGVGMTTLAYASVCRSGLSFKSQLWLRPEVVPDLRRITDAVHGCGAKVSIQIGHCGNMTHRSTAGCTPLGASTGFNLYSPTIVRGLRADELPPLARQFGEGVRMARQSGFDCVEVHCGHGYLVSQFLSPYTNHRRDGYGGSLQNRMRFMQMVTEEVMKAAGSDMGVLVKMNMDDGFRAGMHTDECLQVAHELQRLGVHALVLSGGFVSKAPMYVMRGEMPVYTMTYYMKQVWMKYGVRAFGRFMIPSEPYTPLYFLPMAREFRRELTMPLVYVGGVTSLDGMEQVMAEGFDFVQMGRALLNDPGLVNKLRQGNVRASECDHTNYCIARMYSREMACHQCIGDANLPRKVREELRRIKQRAGLRNTSE